MSFLQHALSCVSLKFNRVHLKQHSQQRCTVKNKDKTRRQSESLIKTLTGLACHVAVVVLRMWRQILNSTRPMKAVYVPAWTITICPHNTRKPNVSLEFAQAVMGDPIFPLWKYRLSVISHSPETGCKTCDDILAFFYTRSFVLELLNLKPICLWCSRKYLLSRWIDIVLKSTKTFIQSRNSFISKYSKTILRKTHRNREVEFFFQHRGFLEDETSLLSPTPSLQSLRILRTAIHIIPQPLSLFQVALYQGIRRQFLFSSEQNLITLWVTILPSDMSHSSRLGFLLSWFHCLSHVYFILSFHTGLNTAILNLFYTAIKHFYSTPM